MDPLKVLVLYGGEEATKHRDALLNWLNSPALHKQIGREIKADKVAAMVANMQDSIDVRVQKMIDWADKGILLLTHDTRSEYGAPNVLEEFGRWIGQKGRESAITLRQKGVKVHSNAQGLVYVRFENDVVAECHERLRTFINQPMTPSQNTQAQGSPQPTTQTINSGPSLSIGGNVGGDIVMGDKVGGDMINTTGDYVKGNKVDGGNQGNIAGGNIHNEQVHHHHYYGSQPADSKPAGAAGQPQQTEAAPTAGAKKLSMTDFRPFLMAHYSVSELKGLCFQIGVDADEFESGKSNLVIGMLGHLQRRKQLGRMLAELKNDPADRLGEFFGKGVELTV